MACRTHHFSPLLIALLLTGCGNKVDSKALMAEATKLEQAGNLNGAVIQLKNAAQAHSDNRDVRLRLGQLYLTLEDYASAEKEFKRARQNGVDAAITDPLIARALMGQHDYQRVVEEISLPDKSSPGYPFLLSKRAQALVALDRKNEGAILLEQAKADGLKSPDLYVSQATLALADKKMDEAYKLLEEGLKLDPKHFDSLVLKADLLHLMGKSAEAETAYQAVLAINPRHLGTRLALAMIDIGNNRLADARKKVNAVLKDSPHNLSAKYSLALIDFKEKKNTEAQDQLAPVLKAAPNYLPAVLLSGAVEYSLGHLEAAQSHLLRVLGSNPNHLFARRLLAAAQLRQGQPDAAEASLAPLKPETSKDAGTLIIAGEIALAQRKYPQAESFFNKAAQLDPQSAAIRTELGLARLGQGESQGIGDLESAAASEQGGQRAAPLLIMAHLKRGEFDAALKAASDMGAKMPQSTLPPFFSGMAYLGKKDNANARQNFEQAVAKDAAYFPAAAALAQMDLKDGQVKAAQGRFDKVLAADPKNIQAMQSLALLALKAGQEGKYLEWLNKASQTDSKALKPRALIAQYYLSKRDFAKALAAAQEASSAQPKNPAALELLGTTQMAAGDAMNATATFAKLIELQPDSAPIRFQQGRALLSAKQNDAAQASFQKALSLNPDFIEAEIALASLHARAGRYDDAIKIARRLQTAHPDKLVGLVLEGDIQMFAKQPAQALAAYDKAASKQVSAALLIKQQRALAAQGRATDGEARLSTWLKQNPDDMAVRAQYAESLLNREQYAPAAEQYRYMSAKIPNNLVLLNNLAYALAQIKDKQAVQVAEQALKLAPDNPSTLDTMGWALVQTGQPAKGIAYLQKSLSKAPDAGDIQYHYAAALAASGDKTHAQNELERLLDSGVAFSQERGARTLLKQLQGKTL